MFRAELGVTPEEAGARVAARAATTDPERQAPTLSAAMKGNKNAAKERAENSRDNDNGCSGGKRGTNADYLTARIARDFPEVHERMKRREFKSVRAAAIEAGIIKSRKPKAMTTGTPVVIPPASRKSASKATVNTIVEKVARRVS